jgi:hypothetical protein
MREIQEGSDYCGVAVRAGDNKMEETARAHPLGADHRTISGDQHNHELDCPEPDEELGNHR